ncbi:MAG: amidohydrolase [Chthoniobacteraceae bacterium]
MKLLFLLFASHCALAADLIVHHAKILTADDAFSTHSAMAVEKGRIVKLGGDAEILALKTPDTKVLDLGGRTVLPGLIDSHVHPSGASMTEFDHPIPVMETIADVLAYVKARATVLKEGEWIVLSQVFITRLREQRYPTRAELDAAAPKNPVLFRTGPDASVNTLALQLSGIDRDFKVTNGSGGFAEKDPATGEPTGILRNCTGSVKVKSSAKSGTDDERRARLKALFADYNSSGLTGICDRDASLDSIERYRALRDAGELSVRIACSQGVGSTGELAKTVAQIQSIARNPLHTERDEWLRIIGIKMYLDGGMLTGSAYMRQPWGVSAIYSITDPAYRGVLFIPRERLLPLVRAAVGSGLAFTAHSVGDGAVHTLLDVYEELAKEGLAVRGTRSSLTHSNFMSAEAVAQAARLGVMCDIQPAWLYLDTHTLAKQFGNDRLRYFQPLRSLFAAGVNVGGGSDHMQKIGSMRSVNPYNPFLGMATAVTRRARHHDQPLHPEEALTREQALRFYTINNARLLHCEDRTGSLEAGKLADFIVIDRDFLTCPDADLAQTQVLQTFLGGREIFRR